MTDINFAILLDRFVRKLHVSLLQKVPRFDKHKVGPGGAMILLSLNDIGPASMMALSKAMNRDKSQMSRAIQALEDKGMITREVSPDDSRSSIVSLTERGDEMVASHQRMLAETIDEVLAPLSEEDKVLFQELLKRSLG